MKKFLILAVCFSTLFAEDPAPTQEKAAQEIQVAAPVLPEKGTPEGSVSPAKIIVFSSDYPVVQEGTLPAPKAALQTDPSIVEQLSIDPEEDIAALEKEEKEVAAAVKSDGIIIDLGQVFAGSPTIYTILFALSIASVGIWVYILLDLRTEQLLPLEPVNEVREKLKSKNYNEALTLCEKNKSILFRMLSTGIASRTQGQNTMLELMKSEGRRASNSFWQKIALLNDIAVIAPMLGLLGTVLGMFYAFYDLNRSMESISALFDGLGISVGTTVGGLVVAIVALIFHSITKYRLTRQLNLIENEAHSLANLIDNQG